MHFIIVGVVRVATLSAVLFRFLATRGAHLALAGPRDSASFQLATAIAKDFDEEASSAHIDVFEIGGSGENVRLLEAGAWSVVGSTPPVTRMCLSPVCLE